MARSTPPGRLERTPAGELAAAAADGGAQWTWDTLAAAAHAHGIQVARGQVRRILLAEGIRWRRTHS